MPVGDIFTMKLLQVAMLASALALLADCKPQGGSNAAAAPPHAMPGEGKLASLPIGDIAGAFANTLTASIRNPYDGNQNATAEGHRLFIAMNCAGCHGYDATGGMGPNLTDAYWRYGGTPAAIYKSISEGRSQGMPSWGLALPSQEIWKIVAYIATLGGSYAPNLRDASLQGDHDVTSVAAIPASLSATGVPTPLALSPLNNSTIPAAPTGGETTVTPQGPANSPPNTINQGSGTGQ